MSRAKRIWMSVLAVADYSTTPEFRPCPSAMTRPLTRSTRNQPHSILAAAGYAAAADGKLVDGDGDPVVLRLADYGYAGSEGSELLILPLEDVGFTVAPYMDVFC